MKDKHTPKFKVGEKVVIKHDGQIIYIVERIHENQYGFPLYDLSRKEVVKNIAEDYIDYPNTLSTCKK